MFNVGRLSCLCFALGLAPAPLSTVRAEVFALPAGQTSLQLVPVGNAGNPNNPMSLQPGSVSYNYNISKFETTIGQYVEFLNAVATTDTYNLYSPSMASDATVAGIVRTGPQAVTVTARSAHRIGQSLM